MRYLTLILTCAVVLGCSETNGPDDSVTEVDICRDCGDGRTIVPTYGNGRAPLPGTRPVEDGDCETWELDKLQGFDGFTGSDSLWLTYRYADDPDSITYGAMVSFAHTSAQLPCD